MFIKIPPCKYTSAMEVIELQTYRVSAHRLHRNYADMSATPLPRLRAGSWTLHAQERCWISEGLSRIKFNL